MNLLVKIIKKIQQQQQTLKCSKACEIAINVMMYYIKIKCSQ